METAIPSPLKAEHDELHQELVKATKEPGKVGEAARAVAEVLHPHFVKEEEYALPPLGILKVLAEGKPVSDTEKVIEMTERLKSELPRMLEEHEAIVAELEKLAEVACEENKPEYARFAEKLILHARTEEDVLYPASIVLGEYIKSKQPRIPVRGRARQRRGGQFI
ncbi:MAG: hemerythrin domain-containing protein [Alphaproteobacteria bacterium]|uniref:Hemerythrin domain-containing protein n=1 Tax=Candidatus Nitrobium versatile TaxID=2884831 RepID=A0A953M3W8_9BACT|nr:hemerythrin domain-containing protein [Candidatus Nitrobium versatile]